MTEITKLDHIELDEFVEYKDSDKQGKFSYVGKVTQIDKLNNYFEMQTLNAYRQGFYLGSGTFTGKLFKGEKPVGWDKFEKNPDAYIQKQQDKREAKRQEEHQIKATTKERVFKLVAENLKMDSKKLLKRSVEEIGGDEKLLSMFIRVALMHNGRNK